MGRMRGTIVRIKRESGFGFIRGEDGTERFFHRSAVTHGTFEALNERQGVTFEPTTTDKGPRAVEVQVS